MRLSERIRLKERQAEVARLALEQTMTELRHTSRAKLASRTALAVGFGGGLALGLWKGGRRKRVGKSRRSSDKQQRIDRRMRQSMPKHWLGHYLVWPFLLATARDFVVSQRPSRQG